MLRAPTILVPLLLYAQYGIALPSHVPLDLLAYPAYAVHFRPDWPISNSSAEQALRECSSESGVEARQGGGSSLNIQHGERGDASDNAHVARPRSFLMRSAGAGQAYLCSVPQFEDFEASAKAEAKPEAVPKTREQRAEQRKRIQAEKQQATERGLALLEPLKGHCLYLAQGWFTYAFCHGSEIRQFHGIRVQDQRGPGIAEDPTQDSYTLGMFNVKEQAGLMDTKKARALGSLREILESADKDGGYGLATYGSQDSEEENAVSDQKRYLVQSWGGGTMCDKTGVERRVEVQFHCNAQASDRIFIIRETAICEYVMVIHTPRLCGEAIFVGSASAEDEAASERRKKTPSSIACRPIVPDSRQGVGYTAGDKLQTELLAGIGQRNEEVDPMITKTEIETVIVTNTDNRMTTQTDVAAASLLLESDPEADAGSDNTQHSNAKVLADSYILVVDPATGEVTIQVDDASGLYGSGGDIESVVIDGDGQDSEAAVQRIMNLLQDSLQSVLKQTIRGEDADGGNQEEAANAPGAANLKGQEEKNPLSRLNRAGPHRHKAIAEQFVKGILKQSQRRGKAVNINAQGVVDSSTFGSIEHQTLKRDFEKKWAQSEEKQPTEQQEERSKDEL